MPRAGELTYYEVIGESGRQFALNKPFTEEQCGVHLMQVGAVMELLPPPPARILECGCGTGWLARLFQKRGYDVVGVDVAPYAIDLARNNTYFEGLEPGDFRVVDAENMPFEEEFDGVVFFDSLHHSVNEQEAIRGAYQALKPGGVLIASEPSHGHAKKSKGVAEKYDVTEKDMPPRRIIQMGRAVGFRKSKVFPRGDRLGKCLFGKQPTPRPSLARLMKVPGFRTLLAFALLTVSRNKYGIVVMTK